MKSIEYLLKAYGMAKESKCEHDTINKSKINTSYYHKCLF